MSGVGGGEGDFCQGKGWKRGFKWWGEGRIIVDTDKVDSKGLSECSLEADFFGEEVSIKECSKFGRDEFVIRINTGELLT